jgi:PAS domain S-box-containing protein
MEQMHSLLKRQLRRHFGDQFRIPEEWQGFIDTVNDAYQESDMDRGMIERSLELSSQELIQANSEVHAIFLAIPDLLFRLDSEGRILNYKAGITTDLLLNPKELLGKRIQDIPLKQVGDKFSEAIQHVRETKAIINLEYSLPTQDQSLFFEARLVPLPEDQIVVIIRNITERKLAEEALQTSELRFKTLTETAPVGIFGTDGAGVTNYVNPRWCEISRLNNQEALGNGWLAAVHPDDRPHLAEGWQRATSGQTTSNAEYRFLHKDGSITFVEGHAVPQKNKSGLIVGYIGTVTDITERKRAEEALRKKEEAQRFFSERLARVLDTLNELSKTVSYDELCRRSVDLALKRLGFDRFGLCFLSDDRQTISGMYGTDEMGHLRNEKHIKRNTAQTPTVTKLLESGKSVVFFPDEALYNDQIEQVGIGNHAVARLWNGEKIIGIYAVDNLLSQKSITEEDLEILEIYGTAMGHLFTLKQAEEALEQAAKRFNLVTLATQDAIYDWDIEKRQIWRNENYQRLFGAPEMSPDQPDWWIDRIHPNDRETVINIQGNALKSSAHIMSIEYRFRRADGSYAYIFECSNIVRDSEGSAIRMIGAITDITERKQAEESLKRERNLFRVLIDNLPDAIYVKDTECRKTIANVADVRNMGRQSEAEVLGKTDFDFYPKDIAAGFYADDLSVIQQGKSVINKEEYFIDKNGKKDWLLTFKLPMKDEQGRIIGLIGIGREITEQKRAMETLSLLSHTVKSIGESISITDLKNNLLFVNESFLKTYGYTEQEVIGKSISIVSCDPIVHEQTVLSETIHGGWQGELLNRKKDGTLFPIFLSTSVVYDEKDQPIGLVGVAADITERKRGEEELENERNLLRAVIDNLPDLFQFKDPNGRYLLNNHAHLKSIGMKSQEDTIGKTAFDFHPKELAEQYYRDEMKVVNTGEPIIDKEELVLMHETNEMRWHLTSKVPLKDNQGKVTGLIVITRDITERKRTEEALQESQALYRSFVEHLPAGVFRKDHQGRFVFINSLFSKLKGMEVDEVLGKTPHELVAFAQAVKATRPSIRIALQKTQADEAVNHHETIMRTGKSIEVEEVEPQLDGTTKYFHVVKSPVFSSDGKIIGTQGVQFDITERKITEEALQERDEKLRNIVENSTNLFYSRNTDQVFTYLSPQTRDIFDCEPNEALVQFTSFMTDNPINKLGCELAKKAIETGVRQETYELELESRKGRRVWVEIQEAPVVKDGKTIATVGAATDITERRWAEMALQVSEKKYRDIVTWAPIGIYQSTHSGKLLTVNKSIVELLGYENMTELIGCDLEKDIYYDEKDRERLIQQHEKYGENITLNAETRWKKKDGSIIWVLMTVHDVRNKSSEILYYEGFVFDITERKHAEEALRESEERYRLLVENSTDIVTEINSEDKYLYVSPNVKSILDFEPTDLVGTDVLAKVYGKDKATIGEILSKLGGSATYRYRDRSGGWHWFESSGRVYYTSSGEQRMVMVSRDITQRRKAEQQLEVSRKQLQHFTEHLEHLLEEERKRISRELHDELGQLLTILKFDLSWLKLEGIKTDSDILTRVDAMMESVNEALASVKRISKEIRPPQLDALGLAGAIQWDIDQVEKKTGLKSIVTVEPEEIELPGQVNTILYRVFREALTNVLRHAKAKHVFIKISQRQGSVILTLRDDGRGITKKELKGTTSLGLVGIRERIRMVGGSFTIEGKRGSGTVVTVEVPNKKKKNGDSKS